MSPLRKLSDRFSETAIEGEILLMRIDTGEFFSVTGAGIDIWPLIDGCRDRNALLAALLAEFAAPEAEIAADLDAFLASLVEAGLVAEA